MLSAIITAKEEAGTIGRAVLAMQKAISNYQATINKQQLTINNNFEIIVVAPDEETLGKAKEVYSEIRVIKDNGKGKAAAMNLAVSLAKGDDMIFSDGDVWVDENSVSELLKAKGDLISGRPVLIETRNQKPEMRTSKFMFWQECLLGEADKLRREKVNKGEFLAVSGYLFLIKKSRNQKINKTKNQENKKSRKPVPWTGKQESKEAGQGDFELPENLLAEDEYLSYYYYNQGYKISYASEAKVYIEYPANFNDWVKQKTRTLAGAYQIPHKWKRQAMRSFLREGSRALGMWKNNAHNLRESFWLVQLFIARVYVWLRAFIKVKILRQSRERVWQRVESTKQNTKYK